MNVCESLLRKLKHQHRNVLRYISETHSGRALLRKLRRRIESRVFVAVNTLRVLDLQLLKYYNMKKPLWAHESTECKLNSRHTYTVFPTLCIQIIHMCTLLSKQYAGANIKNITNIIQRKGFEEETRKSIRNWLLSSLWEKG